MSFPTEVPDAEPGTYRFRADVEQVGPAVLTAPGRPSGAPSACSRAPRSPVVPVPSRTTTAASPSRSG